MSFRLALFAARSMGCLAFFALCFLSCPAWAQQGGSWAITYECSGTAEGSLNPSTWNSYSNFGLYLPEGDSWLPTNVPFDMAGQGRTGEAVTGVIGAPDAVAVGNSNAVKLRVVLTWQPEDGDSLLHPPPASVKIIYKRSIYAAAGAIASSKNKPGEGEADATASAKVNLDGLIATTGTQHAHIVGEDEDNEVDDWKHNEVSKKDMQYTTLAVNLSTGVDLPIE